jgi:hypothetical protein
MLFDSLAQVKSYENNKRATTLFDFYLYIVAHDSLPNTLSIILLAGTLFDFKPWTKSIRALVRSLHKYFSH